jgi:8-oxo-dGTP pyrophosphatase MutT (NUDIX family)
MDDNGIGIVLARGRRLLMIWHKKFELWTIPIGKIEDGEFAYDAAIRECREELGSKPRNLRILVACHTKFGPIWVYKIQDKIMSVKNAEHDKHNQMCFMEINRIKKLNTTEATKLALRYLKK